MTLEDASTSSSSESMLAALLTQFVSTFADNSMRSPCVGPGVRS